MSWDLRRRAVPSSAVPDEAADSPAYNVVVGHAHSEEEPPPTYREAMQLA